MKHCLCCGFPSEGRDYCRACDGQCVVNCILCGKKTTGSVGAAGIKWPMICQKCKGQEDQNLRDSLFGLDRRETEALTSPQEYKDVD